MYQVHPSKRLCELFKEKPFQGAIPEESEFIFLGIDANYAAEIEDSSIFEKLIEYHENGASFWKKYNIHHPFLLPDYKGDGARYHKYFAKLGISSNHSGKISFLELLHLPTVGRNPFLNANDFSAQHIDRIHKLICSDRTLSIFSPATVIKLLDLKRKFPFKIYKNEHFDEVFLLNEVRIYKHIHFSYQYGKVAQMNKQALGIRKLINGI
jgi:hypothetical protein